MIYGKLRLFVLAGSLAAASLLGGCGKSADPQTPPSAQPEIGNPKSEILKFHWLGKKQLAADTNATHVLDIWKLPESVRLETQTLDKLATAPWRLWAGAATAVSNAPSSLLRPLLDDLVQEETYLEMQSRPEGHVEIMLAVRLPADRAALWQSNLPAILQSLSTAVATNTIVTRTNDWTLVSLIPSPRPSPLTPQLLNEVLARLAAHGTPHEPRATNYWVESTGDAQEISRILAPSGNPYLAKLPQFALRILGNDADVLTKGKLFFRDVLFLPLDPWHIPTNTVPDPVINFTALRQASKLPWNGLTKVESLGFGKIPDQWFFWSVPGLPVGSYIAAQYNESTNWVREFSAKMLNQGNGWLASNAIGNFVAAPDGGLRMAGMPFSSPFVRPIVTDGRNYLLFGLIPPGSTNRPMAGALVNTILARTNLIYYDWEISSNRMSGWFYVGQLSRVVFRKSQLPRDSAALLWLNAITPKLTTAATIITVADNNSLEFIRRSSLGLTALELQSLGDWLESPEFPRGTHTSLVPPEKVLNRKPQP